MSLPAFLYRRLSRFVTCEFTVAGNHRLRLRSKYDVASCADVFCHPFYWRVASMLNEPPKTVIDCGGHLGHFSILVEQSVAALYGVSHTEYHIIEPNPNLMARLRENLKDAGLGDRATVIHGLLGNRNSGVGELWFDTRSFLNASTSRNARSRMMNIPWVDLEKFAGDSTVDILKIDIEGAELQLIPLIAGVLARTRHLFVEFHTTDKLELAPSLQVIRDSGLVEWGAIMKHSGFLLASFSRPEC